MSLLIIGGGNMGAAIATSVLEQKCVSPEDLIIVERNDDKREQLSYKLNCRTFATLSDKVLENVQLILFAVKPQGFNETAERLSPYLHSDHILISIMAGVTLSQITNAFDGVCAQAVRAMPNLPARIGKSMTVLSATSDLTVQAKERVVDIFETIGSTLFVDDEDMIDAATAVCGSGPGFLFALLDGVVGAAGRLGFSEDQAKLLVSETFLGAVSLWQSEQATPAELRKQVASKGGTTEAGLAVLDQADIGKILGDAIQAAYKRAQQLGEKEEE